MAKELAKSYDPSQFEDKIYDFWIKGNYFRAEIDKDKKPLPDKGNGVVGV